nr:protein piccolo-like isoform X2 [Camelus dromedarius]XP_031301925.1 protein piccolo-like isoform X2 [Camelus dromedarius]XP_031301926.1 protein piccolo-like isoform X2 [Camelus dromedarius]
MSGDMSACHSRGGGAAGICVQPVPSRAPTLHGSPASISEQELIPKTVVRCGPVCSCAAPHHPALQTEPSTSSLPWPCCWSLLCPVLWAQLLDRETGSPRPAQRPDDRTACPGLGRGACQMPPPDVRGRSCLGGPHPVVHRPALTRERTATGVVSGALWLECRPHGQTAGHTAGGSRVPGPVTPSPLASRPRGPSTPLQSPPVMPPSVPPSVCEPCPETPVLCLSPAEPVAENPQILYLKIQT